MSGFLPPLRSTFRSRTVRHARYLSKRLRLNRWRKDGGEPNFGRSRPHPRHLSRKAASKGALSPLPGASSCNLPSRICVSICRDKSVSCPVMRRECGAGADLTEIDSREVRDDG